jgi:UDP-galactopyranose mutase
VRGGEAYYPINNAENEELYEKYVNLLAERYPNITLGGRLGAYRYWDMDKAIRFALDYAETLEF